VNQFLFKNKIEGIGITEKEKGGVAMKIFKKLLVLSLVGTILLLGTVPIGFTAEKEPIKIGIFGPHTGRFADMGTQALKGAQFAIKEVNAQGGIDGRQIKLYEYDDRGDRKEAVSVARKMIEQDKVAAVIAGSVSLTNIAAAPVINSLKIPMVASFSNALNIVKDHPYCFRWCSVGDVQGYVMAHHAVKEKGFKNFALFIQDEEYGRGIGNGMEVGLEKFGGKIVYKALYSPGEKEFRSHLTHIKSLNPDAVFISGFAASNVTIAIQGHDLGVFPKAQFYGACSLSGVDWFSSVGKKGNGAIGILEFLTGYDPYTKKLAEEWEREFKINYVTHETGLTYDATRLLLDAIKRGGTNSDKIVKALMETKGFKNIGGVVVEYTELREPMLPIAIGSYDDDKKNFNLIKYVQDKSLIDPRPWYQYYK